MAVAPELLAAGAESAEGGAAATEGAPALAVKPRASRARAAAPAPSSPSSGGRSDGIDLSGVATPSATAQTVTKLIWAAALGLIVLEIASLATGQFWSFNLPGLRRTPAPKAPYVPLYPGQDLGAAMPGVFTGPLVTQSSQTNLSGRAGGNLAVGG